MLKYDRKKLLREVTKLAYSDDARNRRNPYEPYKSLTPNNSRRFRKYNCTKTNVADFCQYMGLSEPFVAKSIDQSERYQMILDKAKRRELIDHIKTSVLEEPAYSKEEVDAWLKRQPGVNIGLEDSRILTTIPLGLDLEYPGNLDFYTSETVDMSALWNNLRSYDYLVMATKRLLKDIWLATRKEAEASYNETLNIFNYWGFHNLFAKRALKILEMFRRDPALVAKRFIAKNVVSVHRRLKMARQRDFAQSYLGTDNDNELFSAYLKELINPEFNIEDYLCLSDVQNDFEFTSSMYSQISPYLMSIQALTLNSVLCDYRTPVFYDSINCAHSVADASSDLEIDVVNLYSASDVESEMYATKYCDGHLTYISTALFRGLTHPKTGVPLDFRKGMRSGSMLTIDDMVEDYYNSANYVTDPTLEISDNQTHYSWNTVPCYVQDPTLSDHRANLDTDQTSCIPDQAELDVVYQLVNENENHKAVHFITFGSNTMYPDEFTNRYSSGPLFSTDVMSFSDSGCSNNSTLPYMSISSIIDENNNPRLSMNMMNAEERCRESQVVLHPIVAGLGANSTVLQQMSVLLMKYVEWVNANFTVDNLPIVQQRLIARAKKLSKLLAKHGSPEYSLQTISALTRQLKPLPDSDF